LTDVYGGLGKIAIAFSKVSDSESVCIKDR